MYKRILTAAIIALPTIAFAQQDPSGGIGDTLKQIKSIMNFFIGMAIPLATAFFFWGLIKFIKNAENADLKKEGKKMMINSAVALFLMVGIWSILGYAQSSIGGLDKGNQLDVQTGPSVDQIIEI